MSEGLLPQIEISSLPNDGLQVQIQMRLHDEPDWLNQRLFGRDLPSSRCTPLETHLVNLSDHELTQGGNYSEIPNSSN